MILLGIVYSAFILLSCFLNFLDLGFVRDINFWKFLSHYLPQMFLLFLSLLSFCYCHYACDMLFIVVPQFFDILLFFIFRLFFFFPNCISVLEVSIDKPLYSEILSSAMYDLLMSLLNMLFIFGYKVVCKISLIYIFLRILIYNLLLKVVYFFHLGP